MIGAWLRSTSVMLMVVLTSACDPFAAPDSMMDEYVERVGRVLDQEASLSPVTTASGLPRRRDRVLATPPLDLNILDFLSLYGCELQYVVGERNSVLGRVMQPLNRLRYELRFIAAARDCLPSIDDDQLRQSVEEAIASKRETLPVALWNATWGVEEVEVLLSRAKGYYPLSADGANVAGLASDLGELNTVAQHILDGDLAVSLESIGEVHQRWQSNHAAGQLINSAHLLRVRLDDATELLQSRLRGRPLCLDGKPNNQSDIVHSMFFSVYVEQVQPYLASMRRARDAIIAPLEKLAARQAEVMPEDFQRWYRSNLSLTVTDSVWQRLDASMHRHTESWQDLLAQCGLCPGA